ncbi:glycoside hydrolase family 43 protein [Steroidobacter sp.]|uniref:glycoside hydrolase family 43 protein n=1 Tax=Steroidobacter sp. TaxID=1978227 RepID=UPI001A545226|nr:glycoside hydrolase family 43 protein [Steroidobacter sp.]MBL8267352.1 family 43 glycosylhydrolase [Steroidobacter sp.]
MLASEQRCVTGVAGRIGLVFLGLWLLGAGRVEPLAVHNPVLRQNFPDPFLLEADGRFYAYATNSGGVRVQVSSSDDLQHWSAPTEGLMRLPAWVNPNKSDVWAPEVLRIDSRYVLYFSARSANVTRPDGVGRLCIGTAVSARPDRDFVPQDTPLICDEFPEGVIDVSPFRDGDRRYLYYKNDGNCCGRTTWILARELDATGLATVGETTRLGVSNDQPWEGKVIEAPTMLERDGAYYLFYSANAYDKADYAVGYARCDGPLGPCKDASTQPMLRTPAKSVNWFGPGHQSILRVRGRLVMAYHAWNVLPDGQRDRCRAMHIDELKWTAAGEPFVEPVTGAAEEWRCPAGRSPP